MLGFDSFPFFMDLLTADLRYINALAQRLTKVIQEKDAKEKLLNMWLLIFMSDGDLLR